MKRLLLLIVTCLLNFSYAQEIEVTPNGILSKDTGKSFVVMSIENKSASDLYNSMIRWINKEYKNPQKVIKGDVKDDFVKWDTFVREIGYAKAGFGAKTPFSALLTEQVSFKDGKIKYEIISTDIYVESNSNFKLAFQGSGLQWYLYKKDGSLKQEELKNDIENYFNTRLSELKKALSQDSKDEDW